MKEKFYSNLKTMTYAEFQEYEKEAELGFIRINKHPENENILILNYTEMTTFEKRWNEQTMSARGLILDITNATLNDEVYILARPFEKFPNFGSNEIEGYEDDVDWNEVESIMEKMDGSLGISYLFDGEIRFATRGSFTSEQALKATEIWREKYQQADMNYHNVFFFDHPPTMLVEIIYPENRIVVDYKGREELILLGVNGRDSDYTYDELKYFSHYIGIELVPQIDLTLEEMLANKKKLSANEEGYIIRFKNGKRLKIKGDEYMQVHRIKHGMSTKAKFRAWSEGKLNEYIMMLPEEFRDELEVFGKKLDEILHRKVAVLSAVTLSLMHDNPDRREFAIRVKKDVAPARHKFLFRAYVEGKLPVQMIKDEIYKNYHEYEEVVK